MNLGREAEKSYSHKLKAVMAEIVSILERHDIAGIIMLHEPGFSEFLTRVDPSWSIARLEETPQGLGLRLRSKLEEYGGDRERQQREAEATVNMLVHFVDVLDITQTNLACVLKEIEKHWKVQRNVGGAQ